MCHYMPMVREYLAQSGHPLPDPSDPSTPSSAPLQLSASSGANATADQHQAFDSEEGDEFVYDLYAAVDSDDDDDDAAAPSSRRSAPVSAHKDSTYLAGLIMPVASKHHHCCSNACCLNVRHPAHSTYAVFLAVNVSDMFACTRSMCSRLAASQAKIIHGWVVPQVVYIVDDNEWLVVDGDEEHDSAADSEDSNAEDWYAASASVIIVLGRALRGPGCQC